MKAKLRKLPRAWWTVAKGGIVEFGDVTLDIAMGAVTLVMVIAFVGALVPYGPALLLSDALPNSVGTFLAYQCITGPTCDFYSLMGGLALSVFLGAAITVTIALLVWRAMDWQDAKAEVEAEDVAEDEEIAEAVDKWLRKEGYDEFWTPKGVASNGPT